jgi:hypothetical protein
VFTLTLVFTNTHDSRYANGDRYEGQWKDGKRDGQGTCTHANRDRYKGKWVDGKRHGKGTYTYANRDYDSGEWVDDTWTGVGEVKKTYVTVTPLLFVNSDAFVNMIHVHTDTPLGKC